MLDHEDPGSLSTDKSDLLDSTCTCTYRNEFASLFVRHVKTETCRLICKHHWCRSVPSVDLDTVGRSLLTLRFFSPSHRCSVLAYFLFWLWNQTMVVRSLLGLAYFEVVHHDPRFLCSGMKKFCNSYHILFYMMRLWLMLMLMNGISFCTWSSSLSLFPKIATGYTLFG